MKISGETEVAACACTWYASITHGNSNIGLYTLPWTMFDCQQLSWSTQKNARFRNRRLESGKAISRKMPVHRLLSTSLGRDPSFRACARVGFVDVFHFSSKRMEWYRTNNPASFRFEFTVHYAFPANCAGVCKLPARSTRCEHGPVLGYIHG